jgi:SpoVK/Ycf46/Vps4 family AAA+-type ATPase
MQDALPAGTPLDPYFELAVDGTLKAQGHPTLKADAGALPGFYRPEFVNADRDLDVLVEGLIRHGSGRLLLYGPPGTGKSAFARHLAERLNRPLLLKRPSNIASSFVGLTERKIAAAFQQARDESAVLVFDGVDGFLADRQQAQRNFEISQVNEFLTQLECFDGMIVATTNLMGNLDSAALRRFDLKSEFCFLRAEQARALLHEYLHERGLPIATLKILRELDRLDQLTPGDFAAVSRRARFENLSDAADWIKALADEARVKRPPRRALGFHSVTSHQP